MQWKEKPDPKIMVHRYRYSININGDSYIGGGITLIALVSLIGRYGCCSSLLD
jgi:hypothetical protein